MKVYVVFFSDGDNELNIEKSIRMKQMQSYIVRHSTRTWLSIYIIMKNMM